MLFLLSAAKIILYILLFKGGKTDKGLSKRSLACFGLVITNLISAFMYIDAGFSYFFPFIMIIWWLILGFYFLSRNK